MYIYERFHRPIYFPIGKNVSQYLQFLFSEFISRIISNSLACYLLLAYTYTLTSVISMAPNEFDLFNDAKKEHIFISSWRVHSNFNVRIQKMLSPNDTEMNTECNKRDNKLHFWFAICVILNCCKLFFAVTNKFTLNYVYSFLRRIRIISNDIKITNFNFMLFTYNIFVFFFRNCFGEKINK